MIAIQQCVLSLILIGTPAVGPVPMPPAWPTTAAAPAPWGPNGHRIVGWIAARHLSPQAAAAVADLLGHESLARAATWPDEIRSDARFAHTAPWHYVTIEDGETYESSKKNPGGDAVVALRDNLAVLRDPAAAREDRVMALRWVVHLVGDLHQPLHVGRGADLGGNKIAVKWFGEVSNLHKVWDEGLIDSTRLSYSEFAAFLDDVTPAKVREWQDSTVLDWVEESIGSREQVYEVPDSNGNGSYSYAYRKLPLVELRLQQAGVRLAGLLNGIFGGGDTWEGMPDGLHWVRNAAEYQALARQVYAQGTARLRVLHAEGLLPAAGTWAVALDADETVLDNTLYQKEQRSVFRKATWEAWVAREEAVAVPGAVEFLGVVRELGGRIAIVSNRSARQQEATETNLRKVGAPFDVVLLQEDDPEKEPRWDRITRGEVPGLGPMRIVMYFGDNITDFPGLDQEVRPADDAAWDEFGRSYFMLPNPVYGSWSNGPRR